MSDDLPPNDGDDVNETPDESIDDILGPDPADDDAADEGDPDASAVVVPADIGQHDRVEPIDLNTEMQRSYIEYAMSVIVSRALPDVRDGLKPVHRRIVYAMYDGGYRPDRGYNKCARVVGDVMGHYHPHGDSAIYDALVRLVQDWSLRYPLVDGQGNFGSRGNDGAAAPRYTECRMASIAMEMVRDIEQDTVDFVPNYDGKTLQPAVLPSRFPNLLVNGSAGIAVGMATQIPAHNLREVAAGAQYYLDHPDISREDLLEALLGIIKGPDFPTGALIMGHKGIEEAYRTGRGSIIMRAVVEVEEIQNRQCLVVTELPYQVNPDMLALKIADLVKDGKISGIADIRDETSGRTGQRLVIVLKRDAVAKVVLNNLYKHTQLQTTFGANMLALVDGVPRTLPLDGFIRHWVDHQVEVIVRRTQFRLRKAEARHPHPARLLKALDALDEVIALIRRSPHRRRGPRRPDRAARDRRDPGQRDPQHAAAPPRRPRAPEDHRRPTTSCRPLIAEYTAILASPVRQREIISEELADDRRASSATSAAPRSCRFDGDMSMEDLIPEEEVVVTDHPRRLHQAHPQRPVPLAAARRQGRARRAAARRRRRRALLRDDDPPLAALLHQPRPRLPGQGLRAAGGGSRDAQGPARRQPARVPAGRADRPGPRHPRLRRGRLPRARHPRRPREEDAPGRLRLQPLRRHHRDQPARGRRARSAPAGLATVTTCCSSPARAVGALHGDRRGAAADGTLDLRRDGHEVPRRRRPARDVGRRRTARAPTSSSSSRAASRSAPRSTEYRLQGRGGLGIKVAKLSDKGGDLVGALTVIETDEVMVVMEKGKIVRSRVDEVRHTGRYSQGVKFATPDKGDSIVAVARNAESEIAVAEIEDGNPVEQPSGTGAPATVPSADGVPSDQTSGDEASSSDADNGGDE